MDSETFEKQKAFADRKKPSMHRRMLDHDYQSRQMYMVTMVIEGRRPLFGHLAGKSDGQPGTPDEPHIQLSELGEAVERNFYQIEERHPEIKVIALQMMPDHLHGILFVTKDIDVHLGQVIAGFKAGCNKDYRRLLGSSVPYVVALPQQTGREALPQQTGREVMPLQTGREAMPQQTGREAMPLQTEPCEQKRPPRSAYNRNQGLLFSAGYNDKVLLRAGQLERWKAYLKDNPRRLLAKREHPELFRVRFGLKIRDIVFAAIGNRFLLNKPAKQQVQCSRSLTPEEIEQKTQAMLTMAQGGTILVSPSLSPGEKVVMRAALDAHLPLIFLSPNSFTPFTKPGGEMLEACSRGDLLILSPWPDRKATRPLSRAECLALNAMTEAICNEDIFDFKRNEE